MTCSIKHYSIIITFNEVHTVRRMYTGIRSKVRVYTGTHSQIYVNSYTLSVVCSHANKDKQVHSSGTHWQVHVYIYKARCLYTQSYALYRYSQLDACIQEHSQLGECIQVSTVRRVYIRTVRRLNTLYPLSGNCIYVHIHNQVDVYSEARVYCIQVHTVM